MADLLRVTTGAPGLVRQLSEADAGLRRAVPTSRRIAFLQADGGAGATVTASRLGSALAGRRTGEVLAVDAARGHGALAAAAGVDAPPALGHVALSAAGITRASQARELAPRSRTGLIVVGDGGPVPATPEEWHAALDRVGRFFDVVLTDWGVRGEDDLRRVAAASHVVAVVARADRGPAERAAALAASVAAEGTVPVALVLVDVAGSAGPTGPMLARATDLPVLTVPHAPGLRDGRPVTARLGLRSRAAYAAVAAELVRVTVGVAA
ncbi:hypothetical protein V2J52_03205 [Georgenia sp. MJ173]|uniref:hypothetical protein n=1 Tax=Georgenia sunbinii TaxID=3117728 RepID=UPI002F26BF9F